MKRQNGFTITELLVVMAIVAILLGIGVPSYRYITNSYRLSAEVNSLSGDLQYARAEAVKEGQPVIVCTSTSGAACTNSTWNQGWIVFADLNNDGQVTTGGANPESVLHVQAAFTGTHPDTITPSNAVNWIRFNREGFGTSAAGLVTTTFTLVDGSTGNAAYTRCLLLQPVGMVVIQTHAINPTTC